MAEGGGLNLYGFIKNDGINDVDPLGLNPFALVFADCAKNAIKKAALRYVYGELRDSTICNQAANEIQSSKSPCGWHVFEPSNISIGLFDQRTLASDAVDCFMKKLGNMLVKDAVNDPVLRKLIEQRIKGLKISDHLSANERFIDPGKVRIAARCLGGQGELVYYAYWETSYLNFEDRSTGQVLLPLSRRKCFSNNGPLSQRARQLSAVSCCGCPSVNETEPPPWHPRSMTTDADGFNRFPPASPIDE